MKNSWCGEYFQGYFRGQEGETAMTSKEASKKEVVRLAMGVVGVGLGWEVQEGWKGKGGEARKLPRGEGEFVYKVVGRWRGSEGERRGDRRGGS